MPRSYEIARQESANDIIVSSIAADDDGGLRIMDWSMGAAADQFFGEGEDVESWLDLTPDATRELSVKLFGAWVEDPAGMVASHFADMMRGDTGAARRIRKLLDTKDVPYGRHLWVRMSALAGRGLSVQAH